jgi:hypothetical protein
MNLKALNMSIVRTLSQGLACTFLFFAGVAHGQVSVNMPFNTGQAFQTLAPPDNCSFNFYDNGGPLAPYSALSLPNQSVITFSPSVPTKKVEVEFQIFSVEPMFDALFAYDGASTAAPQISSGLQQFMLSKPGGFWGMVPPNNVAANIIRATASNASGALTFQFESDATPIPNIYQGWSALVREVDANSCMMNPPSSITVNVPNNACLADVQTAIPTFMPNNCNVTSQLRYRINGGPATNVVGFPTSVTIPGMAVGPNVLTWELVDLCGGSVVAIGNQPVTVRDVTKPTIACPSSVTLNLPSGACSQIYNYAVPQASDNCTFFGPTKTLKHPTLTNVTNLGSGITFDVHNNGTSTIHLTGFSAAIAPGVHNVQVYLAHSSFSAVPVQNNPSQWALIGSVNVLSTASGFFDLTDVPIGTIEIPPGQSKGLYLATTDGAFLRYTNGNTTSNDGTITIVSNGHGAGGFPFQNNMSPRTFVGAVKYSAVTNTLAATLKLGLPSGAEFPIGTTVNVFEVADNVGNTSTCSFMVTVNGFGNPTGTLTCNDQINVSIGPDCTVTVTPEDVLQGSQYACYANYIVQVDRTLPFGDGPWEPAVFTLADVGKMYRLRVVDPTNWNSCQANINIFDLMEPMLMCKPVLDIPCNLSLSPTASQAASVNYTYKATGLPVVVNDLQTVEIPIIVNAQADMRVSDLNVRLRISGDPFNFNLNAVLESPTGTIVNLWDQFSGCGSADLFVVFDDEGVNSTACTDLTSGTNTRIPSALGQQLAAFDGQPLAGIWKLRVTDVDGFMDQSFVNVAELIINTTHVFTASLPNDIPWPSPLVTQLSPNSFLVKAPLIDACSDVTLSYTDQTAPRDCQSGYTSFVSRTWIARDVSNNTNVCTQTIRTLRPTFNDVVYPANYDDFDQPALTCGVQYPTPTWLNANGYQGTPTVFGGTTGCNINWNFTDDRFPNCDGTYLIRRTWTVVNSCESGIREHVQSIRVVDVKGPEMACPANVSVSTNSFSCCAPVDLPDIIVFDSCSRINSVEAKVEVYDDATGALMNVEIIKGSLSNFPGNNPSNPDTLAVFGNTSCLPKGQHTVYYTAVDDCGNSSSCSFRITVNDFAPPTAICDATTVVSIGVDDPSDCYEPGTSGCSFGGVSWVMAMTFDDGSKDNCSGIRLRVKRKEPFSDCINNLSKSSCKGGISEFIVATQESDSIKFYCCEVGTTQWITMLAYQLDPFGNIALYPDGSPIVSECDVQVTVQDKIAPSCTPPPHTTISCSNFDPTLLAYGVAKAEDNCCLDCSLTYQGQKGLTHTASYNSFDTICSKGTIVRTFRAFDCEGMSRQCTQRIVVNYEQNYFVKFPDDVLVTACGTAGDYGKPTFFGEDCELMTISFQDQVYTAVPDVCFRIERTWTVTNWCTYNPNAPLIQIPNPNPNSTLIHPANMPGPVVSAPGTQGAWAPTVSKITAADPLAKNYADFWNPNANGYRYTQIISVIDNEAPFIANCPQKPVEICDLTDNDPTLWNTPEWYDKNNERNDLPEAGVDLSIDVGDACSGTNMKVRYLLFLDLDQDGIQETVVSSANPPAAGTVRYNNASTPNYQGGVSRQFDHRAVAPGAKYQFTVETKEVSGLLKASMRWNQPNALGNFTVPQLPEGVHRIRWVVNDGCGNENTCDYNFTVRDCKVPALVCINGLSTNIVLPMGAMIGLHDLLDYAGDNITPEHLLTYSMRKSGTGTGFPRDSLGNVVEMLTFFCDELGTRPIEIWAMDRAGNASFCETYLLVQDNVGTSGSQCNPGSNATVSGLLGTELDFGVEDSQVDISGQNPAGPSFSQNAMTDNNGLYTFSKAVPVFSNFTVTPSKDDNPLNGVTTYDLYLISRHILGIEPLNTPYKMIAADANKSGSITTFDIVELRKLILGIYQNLPNNTSWRFVDGGYQFPNPNNPFQGAFPESKSVAGIQQSMMDEDFVAVKIGDVNGSAIANSYMQADDRASGEAIFDLAEQDIKAGSSYTVWVTPTGDLDAYQMTLQFKGLELEEIIIGEGLDESNFAVHAARPQFNETQALCAAVHGNNKPFGMRLVAHQDGKLSQMLSVSSRITRAEAYADRGETKAVVLRFLNGTQAVVRPVGFELYQNQPNPFINKTMIGFNLPEAGEATLRVFDDTGRLLHMEKGDFDKGYNVFYLDAAKLPGTGGVYFYQVESVDAFASRKMIQTK